MTQVASTHCTVIICFMNAEQLNAQSNRKTETHTIGINVRERQKVQMHRSEEKKKHY